MTEPARPMLHGYEANRPLGSGGHAQIWLGRRSGDGVAVGLCVVDDELAVLGGFGHRLAAVARQVAPLRHPRIVGTVATAAGERSLAVVTEAVDGIPLRALLTSGEALLAATAMQVVDDLLRAVGAAHAAGIVHCGIDPDRVMVTARGEVRLDGFVLARTLALTGGEAARAAAGFASPERLGGSLPDGIGDLWAAAALAHLLLVGTTPVPGTAAAVAALPGVHEVLVQAVAADPSRRFVSASALRGALTATTAETLGQNWRSGSGLAGLARAAMARRDGGVRAAAATPPIATAAATPVAAAAPVAVRMLPAGDVGRSLGPLPPPPPEQHLTSQPRRRRWLWPFLLMVLVTAGGASGTWLALGRPVPVSSGSSAPGDPGPLTTGNDIGVTVQRIVNDAATCDVTFHFTATGSLSGRGNLTFHFEQGDGRQTKYQTIAITVESSFEVSHDWRFLGHRAGRQILIFVITDPAGAGGPVKTARDFDTTC